MRNFFVDLFPGFVSKAKGVFNYNTLHASTQFNSYHKDREKLAAVLQNPALLKVITLQCDLFSLGKITVKDKNGKELEDDPFLTLIGKPNPYQTRSQFLWNHMFWTMLGTANCYIDSKLVDKPANRMYFLEPSKMEWPLEMEGLKDKLIFSEDTVTQIGKHTITYRYEDGSTFAFPLSRLLIMTDLTNGIGNFFKGPSRIDALYKVISNSEHALDAKNINVRFTNKFLVGSKTNGLGATGMSLDEKKDITEKFEDNDKKIFPSVADVQIRRFVDDLAVLKLDEAFLADYFLIGTMYGIPRDVLEAYLSSTYENQEKARAAHISYCLSPKGNEWMNGFESHFGYQEQGKDICIGWDHLPMMQVFEKERAEKNGKNIETLQSMLSMGISLEQANQFLGTSFTIEEVEDGANSETVKAQAQLRGSVGGVQGIIDMQAAVSTSAMTYESAQGILIVVYGYTKEEAQQILGPKNEPAKPATTDAESEHAEN